LDQDESILGREALDGPIGYLSETDYAKAMEREVEPFWKTREESYFIGAHGFALYYCFFRQKNPKATLVIVPGTSETVAKYKEFCFDVYRAGYQVFIYDQRGHGYSDRIWTTGSPVIHVDNFRFYVEDLKFFISEVVKPLAPGKIALFGHSLGGLVVASLLSQKFPGVDRAILNAPMFSLKSVQLPNLLIRLITWTCGRFGKISDFSFGQQPKRRTLHESGTGSVARFNYYHKQRMQDPDHLMMGGVSHGWIYQCMLGVDRLRKKVTQIGIPLLVITAGRDNFVSLQGSLDLASKVKGVQTIHLSDAAHETWNDIDKNRISAMNAIIDFLDRV
jgi:lysophospholipase